MDTGKKIIGLIRASSDRQETASQKAELRNFILSKGYREDEIVWLEAHASATRPNEEYDKLLADVKAACESGAEAVAVWALNRIGRREMPLMEFKNFLVTNKVQLYAMEPEMTLLNPDGTLNRLSSTIFNLWIEFIRSETEEREKKLKRGKDYLRAQGKYVGGQILFGYKIDPEGRPVLDPDETAVVQKIFALYSTGEFSCQSLASRLNALGFNKKGKPWTGSRVQKTLRRPEYPAEGVVTAGCAKECAAVLERQKTKKTKEIRRVSYAAGLIKCSCGLHFYREQKLYRCARKKQDGTYSGDCPSRSINAQFLEALLVQVAVPLHVRYLVRGNAGEEAEVKAELGEIDLAEEGLRRRMAELDRKKERLVADFYSGRLALTDKQFEEALKANGAERERTSGEISALKTRREMAQARLAVLRQRGGLSRFLSVFRAMSRLTGVEGAADLEAKRYVRDIIRMHISEIRLRDEGGRFLDVDLADGRSLVFRMELPRGSFGTPREIAWMSIDGGEFKPVASAVQHKHQTRQTLFNYQNIYALTDEAYGMVHDLRNAMFRSM